MNKVTDSHNKFLILKLRFWVLKTKMKGSVASEKSKALNLVKIIQHNEIMRKKLFLAEPSFIRRCLLDGCEIFFLRERIVDNK